MMILCMRSIHIRVRNREIDSRIKKVLRLYKILDHIISDSRAHGAVSSDALLAEEQEQKFLRYTINASI